MVNSPGRIGHSCWQTFFRNNKSETEIVDALANWAEKSNSAWFVTQTVRNCFYGVPFPPGLCLYKSDEQKNYLGVCPTHHPMNDRLNFEVSLQYELYNMNKDKLKFKFPLQLISIPWVLLNLLLSTKTDRYHQYWGDMVTDIRAD